MGAASSVRRKFGINNHQVSRNIEVSHTLNNTSVSSTRNVQTIQTNDDISNLKSYKAFNNSVTNNEVDDDDNDEISDVHGDDDNHDDDDDENSIYDSKYQLNDQTKEMFVVAAMSLDVDYDDFLFNMLYFESLTNPQVSLESLVHGAAEETVALHSRENVPYKTIPLGEDSVHKLLEQSRIYSYEMIQNHYCNHQKNVTDISNTDTSDNNNHDNDNNNKLSYTDDNNLDHNISHTDSSRDINNSEHKEYSCYICYEPLYTYIPTTTTTTTTSLTSDDQQQYIEGKDYNRIIELPICHHLFHQDCVLKWVTLQNWCPVCRSNIS